jgi:hypothetical protein
MGRFSVVQLNKVSIFTPVLSSENPWIRFPALYLSPFSGMQAIRLETMGKIGDSKGVEEKRHEASLISAALKIGSYILTLGIFPLLSVIALIAIRSVHKFHWIQTSPPPILAFADAKQIKPQTPPPQVSPNPPNQPSVVLQTVESQMKKINQEYNDKLPKLKAQGAERIKPQDSSPTEKPQSPLPQVSANPPNQPSVALQTRLAEIKEEGRKANESIQNESDKRMKQIKQEGIDKLAKLKAQGMGKESVNHELGIIFGKHVKAVHAKNAKDAVFQKNLKKLQKCIDEAPVPELGRLWALNTNNSLEMMANGSALVEMSLANVNVQNPHLSSQEIANVKKAFFMEKAKYYVSMLEIIKEQEQKKGGSADAADNLIKLLKPLADGSCPILQSKHLDHQMDAAP